MRPMWPIRSFLFVPGHRADWVAKAIRAEPEAVILDLEDSVPPPEKPLARSGLRNAIAELSAAGVFAFVRINPLAEGGADDVRACVGPGLAGIVLPKAASAAEIRNAHDELSYREGEAALPKGSVCILPLPETAVGLRDAFDVAKASPRVQGLVGVVGGTVGGDVARAIGYRPTSEGLEQLYVNSKTVLDSRAAGAAYPVGVVLGAKLDDLAATEALVRRAKDIGYSGVAVLHPSHVAIVNRIMRPSEAEIAYCEELLAAFAQAESRGQGAVRFRGAMVDYAMLAEARAVIAEGRGRKPR